MPLGQEGAGLAVGSVCCGGVLGAGMWVEHLPPNSPKSGSEIRHM